VEGTYAGTSIVYTVRGYAVCSVENSTRLAARASKERIQNSVVNFGCGALATGSATVLSYPLDVIRTRLVAQGSQKAYTSIMDAMRKMHHAEGPRALYKGLVPTIFQAVPNGGAQFALYGALSNMLPRLRFLKIRLVSTYQIWL